MSFCRAHEGRAVIQRGHPGACDERRPQEGRAAPQPPPADARGHGAVRQREAAAAPLFPPLPSTSAASHWRGRRAARGGGGAFLSASSPFPPPPPRAAAEERGPGAEGGEPRRASLSERLWGRLKPVSLQQRWLLQRGEGLSLAKKTGTSKTNLPLRVLV